MMSNKPLPNREDLVEYNYAVAGHAGTLCDPDGELFIKPCTQAEIDFYQSALADHRPFAELMPVFMGTLQLNDATDINSINEQLPAVAEHISAHMKEEVVAFAHTLHPEPQPPTPQPGATGSANDAPWEPGRNRKISTNTAIVLENSAYGFKQPNIMDCKLGTRLWADDAPQAKKDRFDRIANETTHRNLGFRVAGMRVFKGTHDAAQLDGEGYLIYDKDWGRLEVNEDNVVEAMRKFIFNASAGVDEETGKTLAAAFRADLLRVKKVLEAEESRMFSSSLLFVCEGDGEALRHAITMNSEAALAADKRHAEKVAARRKGANGGSLAAAMASSSGRSNTRVDSGIDLTEDGELDIVIDNEDGEMSEAMAEMLEAEAEGEEFMESEDEEKLPRVYSLRLIDFAHADWVPKKGPDTNVLLGVNSLIDIFGKMAGDSPLEPATPSNA